MSNALMVLSDGPHYKYVSTRLWQGRGRLPLLRYGGISSWLFEVAISLPVFLGQNRSAVVGMSA